MDYSTYLFDFDGTLADSYAAIAASVNHIRALRGHGPLSVEEVKIHVGRGPEHLLSHTVPDSRIEHDLQRYRTHHPTIMASMTTLLPGARETLRRLDEAGKKIGLCSNKPRLFSADLLRHLKIAEHFDLILGPEDVEAPKPAPDMLLKAIERLGVPVAEVLYIGDMVVDIETARRAGVTVWVVPTGSEKEGTLRAARPDRLLRDLEELLTA
jgi:phosphoglycolate phosphatase